VIDITEEGAAGSAMDRARDKLASVRSDRRGRAQRELPTDEDTGE
jgi:hypothetical protein